MVIVSEMIYLYSMMTLFSPAPNQNSLQLAVNSTSILRSAPIIAGLNV